MVDTQCVPACLPNPSPNLAQYREAPLQQGASLCSTFLVLYGLRVRRISGRACSGGVPKVAIAVHVSRMGTPTTAKEPRGIGRGRQRAGINRSTDKVTWGQKHVAGAYAEWPRG